MDRAIAACKQHGDYQHLASALNNRVFVWVARSEVEKAREDLKRSIAIARELGFQQHELQAQNNLAELSFMMGDLDAALKGSLRAAEIAERIGCGITWSAMVHTLRARILIFRSDVAEARTVVENLRSLLASAKVNDPNACMNRVDDVFLRMVELSLEPTDDDRWGKLLEEAKRAPLAPYEIIELFEGRALNAVAEMSTRTPIRSSSRPCISPRHLLWPIPTALAAVCATYKCSTVRRSRRRDARLEGCCSRCNDCWVGCNVQ